MRKASVMLVLVFSVFLLTGCGTKTQTPSTQAPAQTIPKPASKAQTAAQVPLETVAPKTTNDLPTAIDETEKDIQVIDNDLQEIDQLDMNEEEIEF